MSALLAGGVFDDQGGRASGYARQLFEAIQAGLEPGSARVFNGGLFGDLERGVQELAVARAAVWMADVPNDKPKLVKQLVAVNPRLRLIISKNNRSQKYSVEELAERQRLAGACALIEFQSAPDGKVMGRLLAASGAVLLAFTQDPSELGRAVAQEMRRSEPSAKPRVYIEGSFGAIGSMVRAELEKEDRLELLPAIERGDQGAERRALALAQADLAIVCADGEALETVERLIRPGAKILDVSAARRHAPGWLYALPEMAGVKEALPGASRAANPGCYASCAILLIQPLIQAGLLDPASPLAVFGVGGYSAGGKKMIERARAGEIKADTLYGTERAHPHVGEIQRACGLKSAPAFYPMMGMFERGMMCQIALPKTDQLTLSAVQQAYQRAFDGSGNVAFDARPAPRIDCSEMVGTSGAVVRAIESEAMIALVCSMDNLGKGGALSAASAAKAMLGL